MVRVEELPPELRVPIAPGKRRRVALMVVAAILAMTGLTVAVGSYSYRNTLAALQVVRDEAAALGAKDRAKACALLAPGVDCDHFLADAATRLPWLAGAPIAYVGGWALRRGPVTLSVVVGPPDAAHVVDVHLSTVDGAFRIDKIDDRGLAPPPRK